MRRLAFVLSALLAFVAFCGSAAAFSLQPVGNFDQPIYVTSSPTNSDRLLVAERPGRIIEITPSKTSELADLTSLISCCEVERGLLSIAPAPDFDASGRFYAAYTGTPLAGGLEGDVHVDSFRLDPQVSGHLLREPILAIDHASQPNHNGGQLQFGPDGHLYVSLGDGGGSGDPLESGQDTEELLGKILRFDPLPGQAPSYSIPSTNPFVGGPGRDEVWAYGLRNPWRFSFDRLSGDMVIGDVGQGSREEVDFAPSPGGVVSGGAANYGWNCREGLIAYSSPGTACATAGVFTDPVFDYVHQNPADGAAYGCSIIGGYVVRDPSLGDLYGRYVYADFCIGQIRSLALPLSAAGQASGDRSEGVVVSKPTSFGEDACGRVYVTSDEGTVYRLVGSTAAACAPSTAGAISAGPRNSGKRFRLRLRAKSLGRRFKIVAWVSPCAGRAGEKIQLNQGGKRLVVKRLSRACLARFFPRVDARATFRAVLLGSATLRSRRLAVRPQRLRRVPRQPGVRPESPTGPSARSPR